MITSDCLYNWDHGGTKKWPTEAARYGVSIELKLVWYGKQQTFWPVYGYLISLYQLVLLKVNRINNAYTANMLTRDS